MQIGCTFSLSFENSSYRQLLRILHAIADDLGAILIVAFFYGGSVNITLLAIATAVLHFCVSIAITSSKNLLSKNFITNKPVT